MDRKSTLVLLALLAGVFLTGGVYANPDMIELLGTPAPGKAGRTVQIDASTKFIHTEHFEIFTIKNQQGQSFAWKFDTLYAPTGFPLTKIAPPNFEAGNTWVYVRPRGAPGIGQFSDPARIDELKRRLGITAAQEQAWIEYASELRQTANGLRATRDTVLSMSQQDFQVRQRKAGDAVRHAAQRLLPALNKDQSAEATKLLPGLSAQ
jgi:hypothetical protein